MSTPPKLFPTTKEVAQEGPWSFVDKAARHPIPAFVVKVGGSLLRNAEDYAEMAERLLPILAQGPAWVVVSAAHGLTDALERVARGQEEPAAVLAWQSRLAAPEGLPPIVLDGFNAALASARDGDDDALLAWGEQASTNLLQAHLRKLGQSVPVVELSPSLPPPRLAHAIVPGFFVRESSGKIRVLPRGGSDISAVLAAQWCGSPEVRLWKQGGGIRLEPGVTVEHVDATTLLLWLRDRVRPIHPEAVRLAQRLGIQLCLEDPSGVGGRTRIAEAPIPALPVSERVAGEATP